MKRSPSRYSVTQQHQKGAKFHKKARKLLVHIVELSTAVIKVVIKVINASLSQNQCLQCVTPSLMHVEIPRPRDATELNNDGMIKFGDIYYQTEPNLSIFSKDLISNRSSYYSRRPIPSAIDLQCHFFLLKSFC